MLWINFLHLYQPANSEAKNIKEATEASYSRLLRALEEHPEIKFTLNISACLISYWDYLGYSDLIKRFKKLLDKNQIELTGSAAYHPLLPLIPEKEAIKQIKEQEEILKKYFGKSVKLAGFFLPEMACSPAVARLIKKMGYLWLILDEISAAGKLNKIDTEKIYKDKISGLKIIFRSRSLSNGFAPDILLDLINKKMENNKAFVSATDAELYGLRHIDHTAEFEKLLKQRGIKTLTISEFIRNTNAAEEIILRPSNWESTEKEIKNDEPYALWSGKKNKIQKKLWQLALLACAAVEKNNKDKNIYWARWHLSRGLSSCAFWWASGRDFRRVFGPLAWGPDEIERGANELIRSIRSLENTKTRAEKIKGEKLLLKIRMLIWPEHWTKHWKN